MDEKDLKPSFPWFGFVATVLLSFVFISYPILTLILYGLGEGIDNIIVSLLCSLAMLAAGIAILVFVIKKLVAYIKYDPAKDIILQHEVEASKKRLSDPEYVIALWKAGGHVTPEIVNWAKKNKDSAFSHTDNIDTKA